ncbi:unnamed protein product [Darwinula stevensoni]|uniref:Uncharacterized protein n=1 Tax=Darwinula stevensoni TaxID=69355 RepID=A0A7R9A506_9CRUS|nr:unnamed protein product [Darwinula stevensoni]CAG0884515.1 unnamed protein product [Darwinula stevensoni]
MLDRWLLPLMRKGYRLGLDVDDLLGISSEDESQRLGDKLQRAWEQEMDRVGLRQYKKVNGTADNGKAQGPGRDSATSTRKPSLFRAVARVFWKRYLIAGFLSFCDEGIIKIGQAMSLMYLVRYFNGEYGEKSWIGWACCSGIVFGNVLYIVARHTSFFSTQILSMRLRISCCSVVYRKALRLSHTALGQTTIGQMVNLLSNDVNRFDVALVLSHYVWVGPAQLIIATIFLYLEFDYYCLYGIGLLILFVPVQGLMGKAYSRLRLQIAKRTDERVRLMSEILDAMRVVKMYGWEKPFSDMVNQARKKEIDVVRRVAFLRGINMGLFFTSSKVILFVTFLAYISDDRALLAEKVFLAVALFNSLRISMTLFFPYAVQAIAECLASLKRIQSSLIQALLGELPLESGELKVTGNVGYTGQQPWVFAGSIRQNITFGKPFDEKLFRRVVHACALQKDLALLPFKEKTLVGDRGLTLSGGQKARVSLARALYQEADVYFLDDPLSAVDAHVGKHLFDNCIMGFLKNKPRVLVTHQLQFLRVAHRIIVLNNGIVEADGTYESLKNSGMDFAKLLARDEPPTSEASRTPEHHGQLTPVGRARTLSTGSVTSIASSLGGMEEVTGLNNQNSPMQASEITAMGKVRWKVYWDYIVTGTGTLGFVFLLFMNLLTQAAFSGSDYWLSLWTNGEQCEAKNGTTEAGCDTYYPGRWLALYVYMGLVGVLFVSSLLRTIAFFFACLRSSVRLHHRMFRAVIRTSIKFFDDNPIGRVLNRFSKDCGTLDELLPLIANDVTGIFLNVIGVVVLIGTVNPWILLPAVLAFVIFIFIRNFYLASARSIKRLEGTTRSPVFSHLSASLNGLTTIRIAHAQDTFIRDFDNHQDLHTTAWFLFVASTRWFGIYVDILVMLFNASVTYSFMAFADSMSSDVALAISSALTLAGGFQWGARQSAELENHMTSVERILEYSKLQPEPPLESPPEKRPPKDWPSKGEVVFDNVSLLYDADATPVLKNLSFKINPKDKVGIVGRTGAGKSSLIAALFRLTEPLGRIILDDVDTKTLGLHDVRRRLSIIPQDPGSMRKNLDPFGEYDDNLLWGALEQVELKDAVKDLPGGLDATMSEGGGNFSVGQRQLVCLARALLRRNKVLVLDEATANVDPKLVHQISRHCIVVLHV